MMQDCVQYVANALREITPELPEDFDENRMPDLRPELFCKDGFHMSVQASRTHYCWPRVNYANAYTKVEVGFPSERCEELMPFIDQAGDDPCGTVYAFVPVEVVAAIIQRHGGVDKEKTLAQGLEVTDDTEVPAKTPEAIE